MNNNWKTSSLGEVCEVIQRGISPVYIENGGFVVLNQKCIRNHKVRYGLARRHNTEAKNIPPKKLVRDGDVLVNSTGTGTLGRVAPVSNCPPNVTVDSHITIVRPKIGSFDYSFFGYSLINIEEEIASSGEGASGQTELSGTILANSFQVSYPGSILEQTRIAKILDGVLFEIEKVKESFEKNLKNSRELFDVALQKVFTKPATHWEGRKFGEAYDLRDGTHDSPKYQSSGYMLITSKNLKENELDLSNVNYISEEDYVRINARSKVHCGDVLFAMIGTIGNPVVVKKEPDFAIKNVALFKVPKNQDSYFLKYYLDSKFVKDKMFAEAKGSTQRFVGLGYLREFPVYLPKIEEQRQIVAELDLLSGQTQKLVSLYKQKLALLEELKKSILHKAFSGEL